MNTEEKLERILKIAEDNVEDDVLMCMKMAINDGHYDEWTSRYAVSEMVPVCYTGINPKPKSMCELMDMLGITPLKAYEMVYAHYDVSKEDASKKGFSAPRLDSNMWDCWWCVAMILSDYWLTAHGDPDIAYQMAYEYLSNQDRK